MELKHNKMIIVGTQRVLYFPIQKCSPRWSEDEATEVTLGILLVNDFEISMRNTTGSEEEEDDSQVGKHFSCKIKKCKNVFYQSIRGLFALASMPSHSCVANATHDFADR